MPDRGVENLLTYIVCGMEPHVRAIYEERMAKIIAARNAAALADNDEAPGGP